MTNGFSLVPNDQDRVLSRDLEPAIKVELGGSKRRRGILSWVHFSLQIHNIQQSKSIDPAESKWEKQLLALICMASIMLFWQQLTSLLLSFGSSCGFSMDVLCRSGLTHCCQRPLSPVQKKLGLRWWPTRYRSHCHLAFCCVQSVWEINRKKSNLNSCVPAQKKERKLAVLFFLIGKNWRGFGSWFFFSSQHNPWTQMPLRKISG